MAVRVEKRRGERRLVIDIVFRKSDGSQDRYRKDAETQTLPAARAEDQRRLGLLALTGSPDGELPKVAPAVAVAAPEAPRVEPSLETTTPASTVPLFRDVAKEYMAAYATSNLKPSTRIGYESKVKPLLAAFGHLPINEITPTRVRELDAKLVERGVKPATRHGHQVVLRSIVGRFSVERGYLPEPPRFPKLPRVGKQIRAALTSEEVDRILQAASAPDHRRAFLLAAYAGLRAGEIRALRWKDVDLKAQTLTVRLSRCRGILSTPKSGHERLIPLPAVLLQDLHATPKAQRVPDNLVSCGSDGEPWGEFALHKTFKRTCQRATIDGWRFHDLRHYFVTSLFRAGAPAPAVQALAGHSDLSTTQRYAHTSRADLRAAMDRLVATAWQQTESTDGSAG
jgi:integrase